MENENTKQESTLAELLGTEDPKEQSERVSQLIKAVQTPNATVAVTVKADLTTGKVTWDYVGLNDITVDILYELLEKGRQEILKFERAQLKKQAEEPAK